MTNWRIGCSGFHYKHWKGTFYPANLAQTKWFNYYCQHFNTLEINASFYRFPRLPALLAWYEKSPDGFLFSVKVHKAITHYKKFNQVAAMLRDFYGLAADGLKEKLGPVLFQLPPNFHYTPEHLERIISHLDLTFLNVLEFRHSSWWNSEVFDELGKRNITFCGMSHPDLPRYPVVNAATLYYRFHGDQQLYASRYKTHELQEIINAVSTNEKTDTAFIYFNNDINTNAIYNALEMLKLIQERM